MTFVHLGLGNSKAYFQLLGLGMGIKRSYFHILGLGMRIENKIAKKKQFKKILHTGDKESLDRCG